MEAAFPDEVVQTHHQVAAGAYQDEEAEVEVEELQASQVEVVQAEVDPLA